MQTSHGRYDHRGRHRYSSRLCARQHGRDHRVPVGRVRDRMVHWLAAPAPPRTERTKVTTEQPWAPLAWIDAFDRERRIPVRRGRSRHEVKQLYIRFCFPDAATAEAFHNRFGGECLTHAATV